MFFTRLAVAALSAGAAFAAPLGGLPPVADDIALPAAVPAGLPAAPAIPAAVPAGLSGVPIHRLRRGLTEAIPAGVPAGVPAVPAAPAGLSDAPFALRRAYDSTENLQKIKELADHICSDLATMPLDQLADETKAVHIVSEIAKLHELIAAARLEQLSSVVHLLSALSSIKGLLEKTDSPSLKSITSIAKEISDIKPTIAALSHKVTSEVSDVNAHSIASSILPLSVL
ncbi:hypothetical protein RSOLAG1IB_03242 [Rhizoctonia solani AG-1 IB]|uniref:Uncharacterized protein n=1 Tax=Thanatephorus cucumeris (strain AG1-IB / isolate 7/3/14) TaxID=1108050 RepID=A0A0B7FQW5_THACB|nr:hypothetical protein RSOLAG1IB_03242 [Rhizoctonia solani AG-1 IB]